MRKLYYSLLVLLILSGFRSHAADLISFWDKPQYGGNCFNRLPPNQEYFNSLKEYGAT